MCLSYISWQREEGAKWSKRVHLPQLFLVLCAYAAFKFVFINGATWFQRVPLDTNRLVQVNTDYLHLTHLWSDKTTKRKYKRKICSPSQFKVWSFILRLRLGFFTEKNIAFPLRGVTECTKEEINAVKKERGKSDGKKKTWQNVRSLKKDRGKKGRFLGLARSLSIHSFQDHLQFPFFFCSRSKPFWSSSRNALSVKRASQGTETWAGVSRLTLFPRWQKLYVARGYEWKHA